MKSGSATAGGSVYGDLTDAGPNRNKALTGIGVQSASGGMYNFAGVGYSRRKLLFLRMQTPTFSGVTTTSELLGNVTVSGYDFTLSSSGAN